MITELLSNSRQKQLLPHNRLYKYEDKLVKS